MNKKFVKRSWYTLNSIVNVYWKNAPLTVRDEQYDDGDDDQVVWFPIRNALYSLILFDDSFTNGYC